MVPEWPAMVTKDISIKIGWKPYPFKIIKALVESPIIGWDFMKHHKLDLRWNDSDQITIYDKRSKVSSVLHLKPIPIDQSLLMKNFSLVKSEPEHPGGQGLENPEVLLNEVSTIEALDNDDILEVHDEKVNMLPDSEYSRPAQFFLENWDKLHGRSLAKIVTGHQISATSDIVLPRLRSFEGPQVGLILTRTGTFKASEAWSNDVRGG